MIINPKSMEIFIEKGKIKISLRLQKNFNGRSQTLPSNEDKADIHFTYSSL